MTEINPDKLEVAPGTVHEGIEGWVPELASDDDIRVALEKAFDYRGDVTVTLKNGAKVEGYIFDRVAGTSLTTSFVRLLPKTSNDRLKICYVDISALAFTGRDTAAGKSFEAWIRKYWEKKAAGEGNLNLQPESLE
jgi:tRNA splicing ligase